MIINSIIVNKIIELKLRLFFFHLTFIVFIDPQLVGDSMSLAQSTVSKCVTDVTDALLGIAADFIYLPTQEANEVTYIYIHMYFS